MGISLTVGGPPLYVWSVFRQENIQEKEFGLSAFQVHSTARLFGSIATKASSTLDPGFSK
jgi:hypothetical protein